MVLGGESAGIEFVSCSSGTLQLGYIYVVYAYRYIKELVIGGFVADSHWFVVIIKS